MQIKTKVARGHSRSQKVSQASLTLGAYLGKIYIISLGNFQITHRESQMLPLANSGIKKFHGQQKVSQREHTVFTRSLAENTL